MVLRPTLSMRNQPCCHKFPRYISLSVFVAPSCCYGYRHIITTARDVRFWEMPDDNTPSQKYRGTGIPRYFVTSSTVDNFCKNPSLSVCRLSVCNVGVPYSAGWNIRQFFFGIWYLGYPLTSKENLTEIVPGKALRPGV